MLIHIGKSILLASASWFALVGLIGIVRVLIREIRASDDVGLLDAFVRANALYLAIAFLFTCLAISF